MRRSILILLLALPIAASARKADTLSAVVLLETTMGDIRVKLYDRTPLHRDNFIKLCQEHFYDSLLFHRVIRSFMIQSGDPDSRHAQPGELLGDGGPGYDLPAEIDYPRIMHSRGSLAAAREPDEVNPDWCSSGSQFYIVVGNAHHLDGKYTVFGEVVDGMEVVYKIQDVSTDRNDRPKEDIRILSTKIERLPITSTL